MPWDTFPRLLSRLKDTFETLFAGLCREEPIWGALGNLICCFSNFTKQQGVEPGIRSLAFVGKAQIIPSVVLENNTLPSESDSFQVLSGDWSQFLALWQTFKRFLHILLPHNMWILNCLNLIYLSGVFSLWAATFWGFEMCEVLNIHGVFRHACDLFSMT